MTLFVVLPASVFLVARWACGRVVCQRNSAPCTWFHPSPPFSPAASRNYANVFTLDQCAYHGLGPLSGCSIGTWKHQPYTLDTVFFALELTLFLSMDCIKPNQALWCVLSRLFTRHATPQTQHDKSGRCPSMSRTPTNQLLLVKAHLPQIFHHTCLLVACFPVSRPM